MYRVRTCSQFLTLLRRALRCSARFLSIRAVAEEARPLANKRSRRLARKHGVKLGRVKCAKKYLLGFLQLQPQRNE